MLRVVIPDLNIRVVKYNDDHDAEEFMNSLCLVNIRDRYELKGKIKYLILGDRNHKWVYDGNSFRNLVENISPFKGTVLNAGETNISQEYSRKINLYERKEESAYIEFIK